jgi:methionyl-tRNA synthetase
VWYDALTAYMSGIGFVDGQHDGPDFRYWPADIHAMGKEIIRFHAVYWPAFLMAAEMPLPKQIVAHGWLLFEQEKMSKSKGNVAYPEPIVKVLGNDALRYYLMREVVFGQDGNFSRDALITRYNADLANGLGNLASRTLTMIGQYFDGSVPKIEAPLDDTSGVWSEKDLGVVLEKNATESVMASRTAFEKFDFSAALMAAWFIVSQTDQYLSVGKPWAKVSDPTQLYDLQAILYRAAEALRIAVVLAYPIIPDATQKIWEQLGQTGKLGDVRIDQLQWGGLKPGTKIGKPEAVFPRVEKKEAMEKIEAMENEIRNPGAAAPAATSSTPAGGASSAGAPVGATAGAGAAAAPAPGAKITIDDFAKVELRVGVVKSAEKVQGADRLLKVMVDIGDEVRQVLAGIALAYAPEELVGRKVVVVTNLAPRKMRGQESNGMLLAASDGADGKPVLVTFAEEISAGAKVK